METFKPPITSLQPIDVETLLGRCMGRIELMERMLSSFTNHVAADIDQLTSAIDRCDDAETARLAHKLKGTSLTVSAVPLASIASEIHETAKRSDGEHADLQPYAPRLQSEFNLIVEQVDHLKGTN